MESIDNGEIIFVEDNPSETELILRILKKSKLYNRVISFKDGISALQYLYNNLEGQKSAAVLPKVIFLDLRMPRIDGLDILKKIKSYEGTKNIPVVMLTSSHEESIMKECYKAGVNSYIIKPTDYNSFVDHITKAVLYWACWNQSPQLTSLPKLPL